MKKFYLVALGLFATVSFAQVKVGGTPNVNPDAMFEIEATNKGMLLPRVALVATNNPAPLTDHVVGMTVYNTAQTADAAVADKLRVSPGFYYNDGTKWSEMVTRDNKAVKFFYMPSMSFSATAADVAKTQPTVVDLYAEYKAQFDSPKVGSTDAPMTANNSIPYFKNATDLYYYVTDYDTDVFNITGITADGKMSYTVISEAKDCSLINIVFVVK